MRKSSVDEIRRIAHRDASEAVAMGATSPWGDGVVLTRDGESDLAVLVGHKLTALEISEYERSFRLYIDCHAPMAR